MSRKRIYFVYLLLFVTGPFIYFYLTFSTIPSVSIIVGAIMGTLFGGVSLLVFLLVARFIDSFSIKWFSHTAKIAIVCGISISWICAGVGFSRPSVRFSSLFFNPVPSFIHVFDVDGVSMGVDGTLWVFTCKASVEKIRNLLTASGYGEGEDKGEKYWRARLQGRSGAVWQVDGDYDVFLLRNEGNGAERWAFVPKDNGNVHFVYCTFSSGL